MPLVVAAFAPELGDLAARVRTATVGIGLVAAAHGATRALAERRPDVVILVGTCGAYAESGLAIGDVVVASRVVLASAAAARGDGALLPSMTLAFEPDASVFEALVALGGKPAAVATTLALTTTDSLAVDLQRCLGPDVEHLEAYAVAHVCAALGVPFAAVFAVANDVGPRGRDQWRAHHSAAEVAAADLVSRWLSARGQSIRNPT